MMKSKICRLCAASFVPDRDEGYCEECIKPRSNKNEPGYKRMELLIKTYEIDNLDNERRI